MNPETQAIETPAKQKGLAALVLVVAETGLGSILHGFHVPFGGHFLSLNQIFFLCHFAKASPEPFFAFEVSSIAALFKALSPAGKKLTPMLAISVQGLLLNLGMLALPGFAGALLGASIAALWAFVQPLLIYWLFYGSLLADMARFYVDKVGLKGKEHLLWQWLFVAVGFKVLLAWVVVWAAYRLNKGRVSRYQDSLLQVGKKVLSHRSPFGHSQKTSLWSRIFAEITRPLFLISLVLTAVFLSQAETSSSMRWWILLRPLAVAVGLFFVFQALPWEKLLVSPRWKGLNAFVSLWRGWQQSKN